MSDSTAIGVDVGGTKILGLVTAGEGRIVHRLQAPTPRDPALVAPAIAEVVAHLVARDPSVSALGVGLPGLVDRQGVLHYGPNVPGVIGLDIVGYLQDRFGVPTMADNDASCAAVAEHRLGAARGHRHAVIVTQGTGIGGGLIVDDRLVRGANGFAGEPGHMLIDPSGPRCACGADGCWESVASGAGLATIARRYASNGRAARIVALAGGDPGHIRGEHVAAALIEGNADAAAVIDDFAWWVAQGLAGLITLLDPSVVVLGGGLTAISDHFIPELSDLVMARVMGGGHRPVVPIVPAQLGPEAGAVGAALLAREAGWETAGKTEPSR